MWTQIGVLSEDEVFNDTFSVNTLVQIDHSDPITVSLHCVRVIYMMRLLMPNCSCRFRMIPICVLHFVMKMLSLPLIMWCICWKRIWLVARVKIQRSFRTPVVSTVWPFLRTAIWLFAVYPMEILLACVQQAYNHPQYSIREWYRVILEPLHSYQCILIHYLLCFPICSTINPQHASDKGRTFVNVIEWYSEYYFCCANGIIYK